MTKITGRFNSSPAKPKLPDDICRQSVEAKEFCSIVVKEVNHCWLQFGLQLNISYNTLKTIEQEQSQMERRFMEVFSRWEKNNDPPCTWETVLNVLVELKENKTASKVTSKLISRRHSV